MCFEKFVDNKGALWHTGISYIRIISGIHSLLVLFTGFVDKNKKIRYRQTYPLRM